MGEQLTTAESTMIELSKYNMDTEDFDNFKRAAGLKRYVLEHVFSKEYLENNYVRCRQLADHYKSIARDVGYQNQVERFADECDRLDEYIHTCSRQMLWKRCILAAAYTVLPTDMCVYRSDVYLKLGQAVGHYDMLLVTPYVVLNIVDDRRCSNGFVDDDGAVYYDHMEKGYNIKINEGETFLQEIIAGEYGEKVPIKTIVISSNHPVMNVADEIRKCTEKNLKRYLKSLAPMGENVDVIFVRQILEDHIQPHNSAFNEDLFLKSYNAVRQVEKHG